MIIWIFFLVLDEMVVEKIIEDLYCVGIKDLVIYVVVWRDKYLLVDEIFEVGVLELFDVVYVVKWGVLIGGVVGLFVGLGVVVVYLLGLIVVGGVIVVLFVVGVVVGSWFFSLVGVSVINSDFVVEFEDVLDVG